MGEKESTPKKTLPPLPGKFVDGKDELNLAEFPLGTLAERVAPDQKTLVFEDTIWDEANKMPVTRQLTIAASQRYGLPTATDDEVILALIQLTKLQKFQDRKVYFSRYQLIKLLNWRNEGRSYERLTESLNRWIGVTFYYKNAWRDPETNTWVDKSFHILDNVNIYQRERRGRKRKEGTTQSSFSFASSSFTWNEVLFKSFTNGHLKTLDYDFFKQLKSAVSKRLFRFLDKRFHHKSKLEFDLHALAMEHIGVSRQSSTREAKRRIQVGIKELEEKSFIEPIPQAQRFKKVRAGEWRVVFTRSSRASKSLEDPDTAGQKAAPEADLPPLVALLVKRNVTQPTAHELVNRFSQKQIQFQVDVFDWLMEKQDKRVSHNPAGYLVEAIRKNYGAPKGFKDRATREREAAEAAERKKEEQKRKQRQARARKKAEQERERKVAQFWRSLTSEERDDAENAALQRANNLQAQWLKEGGVKAEAVRKNLLDEYALLKLDEEGS